LQTGGAKVERRRREDRGAKGAEWPSAAGASIEALKAPRGWVWGGGIPSPMARGLGRRHCPSPENFSIWSLKMVTFSAFWALAHVARGHGPPGRPWIHQCLQGHTKNTRQAVHFLLTLPSPHVMHTLAHTYQFPPLPGLAHWTITWSQL